MTSPKIVRSVEIGMTVLSGVMYCPAVVIAVLIPLDNETSGSSRIGEVTAHTKAYTNESKIEVIIIVFS